MLPLQIGVTTNVLFFKITLLLQNEEGHARRDGAHVFSVQSRKLENSITAIFFSVRYCVCYMGIYMCIYNIFLYTIYFYYIP